MLSFKMRGYDSVKNMLKDVPHGAKKIVLPAVTEYLIGNENHGLRHYPPLKDQAYLSHTPPSYERTGDAAASWKVSGLPYAPKIKSEGVDYVQFIPRWKRYGWREWAKVIDDNMAGALRHANAKLKEWLRSK